MHRLISQRNTHRQHEPAWGQSAVDFCVLQPSPIMKGSRGENKTVYVSVVVHVCMCIDGSGCDRERG